MRFNYQKGAIKVQKLRRFSLRGLYLGAIFLMLSAGFAFAQQIPHLITYKGDIKELAKDDGKVDKDEKEKKDKDAYNLTFRIYNLEIGGAALWEETHLQTPVKKGNFEVILGSIIPLDLKFDEDYWLSIEVDGEGEIIPRERMTSVGYAYMSDDTWKLGGRYFEEYALIEHNHLGEDIITPVAEAVNADTVDGLHADQLGGIKDHGLLEGLADDDHLQYLNILRGDERYAGSGWDGLTRLKTAQDHIADLSNPHAVTLEQLGHLDNNPEEEAPTATERGEPTGIEIQGWADDIVSWGHANLVTNLNADMLDGFHAASSNNPLPNTLLALGADGKFPTSVIPPIIAIGLWTDEGTYIYPNNTGSGLQIMDTGHLAIAGNAGIVDAQTANPKGTLTIGQSLAGNNIDYSLVIARHGTNANPGTYSHTAPALLVQDFAGTNVPLAIDRDGLVRINAYRIGDTTENAANVTLFNVTNDQGGALRVDGRRNTFIGYWNEVTSTEKGSLFVKEKVGIGTTAPNAKLEIANDTGDAISWGSTTDRYGVINFANSGGGGVQIYGTAGKQLHLGANDAIAMTIEQGGNIGIGTINPYIKLLVKQSLDNPNAGMAVLNAAMNHTARMWMDGAIFRITNDGADGVAIDSVGNVGIGTAVPQGKLDVNGAIYQRGALLHADYVFEPDYKLESIEEHADYMWQEKHLKAVPKAAKAENGQEIVEVGARGKGVLEELEKAHIYIAQLNERIKKLEAKLEKQ